MSPETRELMGMYEEAYHLFAIARTRENEERLEIARTDFLEAFRDDVVHNLIANDSAA